VEYQIFLVFWDVRQDMTWGQLLLVKLHAEQPQAILHIIAQEDKFVAILRVLLHNAHQQANCKLALVAY
jgi:hypothetical protein